MSLPQNTTIAKSELVGQVGPYAAEIKGSGGIFDIDMEEDFSLPREPPEPIPQDRYPRIHEHQQYSESKSNLQTVNISQIIVNDTVNRLVEDSNRRMDSRRKVDKIKNEEITMQYNKKMSNLQTQEMIDRFSQDIARRNQNKMTIQQEKQIKQQEEEDIILNQLASQPKLSQAYAQSITERLMDDALQRNSRLQQSLKEKQQIEQDTAAKLANLKHTAPKSEKLARKIQQPVYERLSKDSEQRMLKQKLAQQSLETSIRVQSVPKTNNDKSIQIYK